MTGNVETKRFGSNESGATVVEFAFIVVLLLVIIFGILEFAFLFAQLHLVENSAREGVRAGIVADNYETFIDTPGCTDDLNRFCAVEGAVKDYLDAFYKSEDINSITVQRIELDKSLKVTVDVKNFFPELLSGFIPGYNLPPLSYSAIGIYEDPDEFDQ